MRALLLVGSPRGKHSTSYHLGSYLLGGLRERDWETIDMHIQRSMANAEGIDALIATVYSSDLVILSFPLYVDEVPAAVIRMMEAVILRRGGTKAGPRLVALSNCGFPEARQNELALEVCRLFARDVGMRWAGSLAMGQGPSLGDRELSSVGRMARHVRKALDLAADELASERDVPDESIRLMARPFLPPYLYRVAGNYTWRTKIRSNGSYDQLCDRPDEKG